MKCDASALDIKNKLKEGGDYMPKYICSRLGRGCSNHKTYYDQYAKCEHCGASVVLTKADELER